MTSEIIKACTAPILAAGRGWIVIEKPPGLSVGEKQGSDLCSLLQSRIVADQGLAKHLECDSAFGLQPVHRLDRETSGILLLACRSETFSYFARQFEARETRKRYIALLHGELPEPGGMDRWGTWTWPLSQQAGGRSRPAGSGARVPSETRFRVLRRSDHYTLIECELVTGRKHQIRRHARLAGHAVVGDARYGTPRSVKFMRDKMGFTRLALHSFSLQVRTPESETPTLFESPAIPEEILRLIDQDQA